MVAKVTPPGVSADRASLAAPDPVMSSKLAKSVVGARELVGIQR